MTEKTTQKTQQIYSTGFTAKLGQKLNAIKKLLRTIIPTQKRLFRKVKIFINILISNINTFDFKTFVTNTKRKSIYIIKQIKSLSIQKIIVFLKKRKTLMFAAGILVVLIPMLYLTLRHPQKIEAGWYNDNWQFRQKIIVTNNTTTQSNVYINFTGGNAINTSDSTKFQTDCGDIRFFKENGEPLPYYIVSGCGSATTVVHAKFDSFKAGSQNIYMYYGNASINDGGEGMDFSTEASSYTIGAFGNEEIGPGPVAWWKFDEGYGTAENTPKIEQQINILDQTYSTTSGTDSPTDNSLGIIHWDASKYPDSTVYFEIVTNNSCEFVHNYATLYATGGTSVANSTIDRYGGGGVEKSRTSAILLDDGTDYTFRVRTSSCTAYFYAARLIIQQSNSTKITDTQTQIELGNAEVQASATATQLTDKKIYNYDSSKFTPTPTAYFEASIKSSQPTIEQQINIIDQTYTRSSTTDGPTDNSLGIIHWDASKYPDSTVYFEAVLNNSCEYVTNTATLYTSGGASVSSSSVSNGRMALARVRSSALTLTDGTDYTVQFKAECTGYLYAARLIIQQSNSTKITDTQTQIELGNAEVQASATATQLTDKKIYNYDSSKFTPTPTAYFEASIKSSQPTIEQQINIIDQTYSTTSGTDNPTDNSLGIIHWDASKYPDSTVYFEAVLNNSCEYVTNTATLYTSGGASVSNSSVSNGKMALARVRSSALTLTDGTDYTVRFKAGCTGYLYSARLIIQQSNSTKITDTQTQVEVGNNETTTSTSYANLTNKKIWRYDSSKFTPTPTAYFEATLSNNTAGQIAYAALYTDGTSCSTVVSGSEVSVTGTTWSRARSSGITLSSGTDYSVCIKAGANTAQIANAKIILDQSAGGGITALETLQQQVNTLKTDTDSTYTNQKAYNRYNPGYEPTQVSFAGGTLNVYYETTMKTSAETGYSQLYNATNSAAISGSEVTSSSTGYERKRSGDITSTLPQYPGFSAKEMETQIKNKTTNTTSVSNSWMVIQVSSLATSSVTAYADLYNVTDTTQVSGSELSTNSTSSFSRQRSSAITLTTGKEYVVRLRSNTGNVPIYLANAKIILDQSAGGGITALETLQQQVNTLKTDTDSTYTNQKAYNRYNPGYEPTQVSFAGGTLNVYYETTMKTSAETGYSQLYNATNSAAISGSEVTSSSTSYERKRSGDITSTLPQYPGFSAKEMETQIKNKTTNTTSVSNSWMVIQVSSLATSGGTTYADLYNLTDSTQVSGSEVSTNSSSWTRQRSSAITLTTGKEYVVRLKSGSMANAKIILDQSDSCNGISATETIQQYISTKKTDTDSTYSDTYNNNAFNVSNFNTINSAYFEATLKTSAGTGYIILKNDTDGTTISGSELTTSSTSYTRLRNSSSIASNLPSSSKEMDTRLKNSASSGNTTSASSSWLILQVSISANINAHDSTNSCNHGAIYGPTWSGGSSSSCLSGNCLSFDGSNDYILIDDSSKFNFVASDDFTITAWIKSPPKTSSTGVILSKYLSTTGSDGGYKILMESDGDITAGIDDDATWTPDAYITSTEATYDDNIWHHLAVIKDGTSSLSLYIDGQLIVTNSSISGVGSLANTDNLYIGIDGDSSSNPFKGLIDEVKIYPYARSEDEIKVDYNGGALNIGTKTDYKLDNGLVGYWKMDETSGNDAADSSGNGITGTATDTLPGNGDGNTPPPATASAKFGYARDFDGIDDGVDLGSCTYNFASIDFTFAAWAKLHSKDQDRDILTVGDLGGAVEIRYDVGENNFQFDANDSSGWKYAKYSQQTPSLDTWYHVVGVRNGNSLKIYINGVEGVTTGTLISNINWSGCGSFIGKITGESRNFDGLIDEVRIYNRALSAAEVQQLYNWAPGPVGYWKMDEGTGQYAYDTGGNNLVGTLINNPIWSQGKTGRALDFNSTNSTYVSVSDPGTNSALDFPNGSTITVEAWIKPENLDNYQIILTKGLVTGVDEANYQLYLTIDGELAFNFTSGTGSWHNGTTNSGTIQLNTWQHVAVTYTFGTNELYFYINGILTDIYDPIESEYSPDVSNNALWIGADNYNGCSGGVCEEFNGQLDDIKIYNYARSSAQIIEDMNAGHPTPGSPVGSAYLHYMFDEGYGTTAGNSGTGGTDINGTLSTNSIWNNNGKFGKAIYFWDVDHKVSAGDVDFVDGLTQMTISLWVNPSSLTAGHDYISKSNFSNQNNFAVRIPQSGDPTDEIRVYIPSTLSADEYYNTTNFDMATSVWTHMTVVYDGTLSADERIKVYKNGVLVSGSVSYGTIPSSLTSGSTSNLTIGDSDESGAQPVFGLYDDVKIYNTTLTADQIKILYNQGAATVMGARSTDASNNPSWSSADEYCPPGQGSTCTGPEAEWNFDENTGTTTNDISGNNNTGTLDSTVSWTVGKSGSATFFPGSSGKITVADSDSLDLTSSFTLETWINWFNGPDSNETIISKAYNWGFEVRDNGTLHLELFDSTNTYRIFQYYGLTTYNWNHIAVTYNSTDSTNATFYINGQPHTVAQNYSDSLTRSLTYDLDIGGDVGTSRDLSGKLDNARIYNYARTPEQIAWDYNKGEPIAEYRFDECQGDTVYNQALNANGQAAGMNGTINFGLAGNTSYGTCSSGVSTEMWNDGTTGKINASLGFDGSDDYVNIADNDILDINSEFSVSAWVNRATENTNDVILAKDNDYTTGTEGGYILTISSSDNARFYVSDNLGSGCTIFGTSLINTPGWHHITATYINSSNPSTAKIYVDGVLENDSATGCYMSTNVSNALNLHIGSESDGGHPFDGQIDDVRIYNYALTDTQVKTLYNGGAIRFQSP